MKSKTLLLIAIVFQSLSVRAQISDTALLRKLSVDGFCLCQTTLTALKQANTDLKQVEVEEMGSPKQCYGHDSRFTAGTGYYSEKHAGIIFQKDPESDYISKIILTKQFKGNLPDGHFIDLSTFRLKDLFKLYPQLKNKWGSRDCSDYWNFSNDTLSFFVKIDRRRKPQSPVDEGYYLDKPVEAVDLTMSCHSLNNEKQAVVFDDSSAPVFFIDSIRVNNRVLQNYAPSEIAKVALCRDSSAVNKMGPAARNGLVYIETKKFARKRYWTYFKSKSAQYNALLPSAESDKNVQYILNKKVLKENFEGDLAAIDDQIFKKIQIITKQQLEKDYGIAGKDFGVIITTDIPGNLHNSKSKF